MKNKLQLLKNVNKAIAIINTKQSIESLVNASELLPSEFVDTLKDINQYTIEKAIAIGLKLLKEKKEQLEESLMNEKIDLTIFSKLNKEFVEKAIGGLKLNEEKVEILKGQLKVDGKDYEKDFLEVLTTNLEKLYIRCINYRALDGFVMIKNEYGKEIEFSIDDSKFDNINIDEIGFNIDVISGMSSYSELPETTISNKVLFMKIVDDITEAYENINQCITAVGH